MVLLPASPWDMSNWFNWYWWLPDNESNIEEENVSLDEKNIQEENSTEIISEKPKPKRKRKTPTKKIKSKNQESIELVLRPTILEELEKEAIITDSTLNQVIQVILEAHIESKTSSTIQTDVWKCNYCEPEKEFRDYFEFSEHFFNLHMQPGLQKISQFKQEQ